MCGEYERLFFQKRINSFSTDFSQKKVFAPKLSTSNILIASLGSIQKFEVLMKIVLFKTNGVISALLRKIFKIKKQKV